MCFTPRGSSIKGPSNCTRALFRCNAFSAATSTAADRLTETKGVLSVPLLARANVRADAVAILATVATNRHALFLHRVVISLVAQTLFGTNTSSIQAALGTLGDAELLRGIQFIALLADALSTITTSAIVTANRTCGHALSELV